MKTLISEMKYYRVHVSLTYSFVFYTVLARSQEEAIMKAIDRAKECNETETNKIHTAHCLFYLNKLT